VRPRAVRKWLVALLASLLIAGTVSSPAIAGDGDIESTGAGSDDVPDTFYAGVETYQGGFRGTRTGGCTYAPYNKLDYGDVTSERAEFYSKGIRYALYIIKCGTEPPITRYFPDPPPRPLAGIALGALANRFVPKPEVAMAPKPDRGIVKLGEWFWTTTPFVAQKATAAVPQTGLWATATAVPVSLTFYPGDGNEPVTCDGPGEPWLPEYGDELPTECMYTYRNSSAMAPNHQYFEAALEIT
jgi:hypothetical protein